MKKKLLSILTLLLCLTTGAWADATWDFTTMSSTDEAAYNSDTDNWEWNTNGYFQNKFTTSNKTTYTDVISNTITQISGWSFSRNNSNGLGAGTIRIYKQKNNASGYFGYNNSQVYVKFSANKGDVITFTCGSSESSSAKMFTFTNAMTSSNSAEVSVAAGSTNTVATLTVTETGDVTFTNGSSKLRVYSIVVSTPAPAGPTINTQPQSANYVTGADANALTVAATTSGGNLSYQWYSNTTGIAAPATDTDIDGAIDDSYTPSTASAGTTYYYCVVKDENGSTISDVATITVSAATAPTFTSITPSTTTATKDVASTITAVVTGTPTPTIQWYRNTENVATVDNEHAIEGATELTLNLTNSTTGTFYYYAVATNGISPDATSDIVAITVSLPKFATPTVIPNDGTKFLTEKYVKISNPDVDATYKYSTDNGATWTNMQAPATGVKFTATTTVKIKASKANYLDSDEVSVTITKLDITLDVQTDVTGAVTWDWSEFGLGEIKLDYNTCPEKDEEIVLSNLKKEALGGYAISDNFNAQALKVKAEYPVRGTSYFQGPYIKFNTTVPGTLSVSYSNTGSRSKESERRFLNINGTNYDEGTMNTSSKTTSGIVVAAGEVTISGSINDGTCTPGQYLRIYSIVFTPVTNVSGTITPAGWASFSSNCALDLSTISGGTAYYASNAEGNTVTLKETTATVPAGTGLMIKGEANAQFTINIAESGTAISGNLLKASNGSEVAASTDGAYHYVFGYDKNNASVYGFYNLTQATTVPAGKAYLETSTALTGGEGARALIIIDDENTTGISATLTNNETMNNEYFDLQGRRVAQPTKGLYIVNGKKVIVK